MKTFGLTISSPPQKIFEDKVYEVTAPGEAGWMTILAGHAPLLATLKKGKIIIKKSAAEAAEKGFEIEEGIMEVTKKGVSILIKKLEK